MSSHNWPSVQIGQSQYPPFNPNTASYALEDTQTSTLDVTDLAVTSPASSYHLNPEHDIDGAGGMIGLTLDQYKSGQRVPNTPSAPLATSASNKRQLPHDQMMSSPNSQSGENSGNHQTQPKKRARKSPKGKATPPASRTRIFVLGESLFPPEDFAAGLEHFKEISATRSLSDDDLERMRDFLTWGEDEQRKWLAKLSPEQFGVVLFAEKQNHDNQQFVVAQANNAKVTQLPNHDAAASFGSQQQQGNGVQNLIQDQFAQNMMAFDNFSNFNQQFSPLAPNANFQQMAGHTVQGQSVQFGTHIPSYIVGPNGQLLPQQQNMFGNMPTMPSYQSSNMQNYGAYQQQFMVNGQLMNVALQPAFGGHQGGHFNSPQLIQSSHGYCPQQHGTNVNHTFNSMGQQNRTASYSLPSGGPPPINANQGMNFVLPSLSHEAKVAEAQLRAATMRRQHADLRARGLPVPNVPNTPKPPLVMSGPGLGALPGIMNNMPYAPRSNLVNAFEGIDWEKDPEKDAKGPGASPPNNTLGGHTPTGDGFPVKFADVSGPNPIFLSQTGSAAMINLTGRPYSANTTTPIAFGHHGAFPPALPFYQVQLPNSAGQTSLGPNAQGSTSPAGAANGTGSKTSPKSKKTTKKKPSAPSKFAISSVANSRLPNSVSGPSTSQTAVGTAQPNASFSTVQDTGYSHGSQADSTSLTSSTDLESVPEPSAAPATGSTYEASYIPASAESELTAADYDGLDQLSVPITTPELEPSTPNEAATPEDFQPTDFNNDSLDGFFDFLDTPGVAASGDYVGVDVYNEAQPVGLGFDIMGDQFDPMADVDFADMDFSDMGFDNWTDADLAQ
ncbi:hypothetical protein V493_06509 [Pseudogymnoascus sp. VKM F-4281 (FW-2241)]|nr:hypothetical protein V493_06509 [Pseudogymnoascus sp. VKM F-4281 (FW-2241)]